MGATGNNLKNTNLKIPLEHLPVLPGYRVVANQHLVLQTLFNALNLLLNNNKSRKLPKDFKIIKELS